MISVNDSPALALKVALVSAALMAAAPMGIQSAPSSEQRPAASLLLTGSSKPFAPIGITHRFASPPQVGQPLEIILSITADADLSEVSLNFAADDPLAMIDPIDGVGLSRLTAGQGADVAVTVLPLIDQDHYLSVAVTAVINGIAQTRSISVPIRLPGSGARKTEAATIGGSLAPTGNSEERVRSFRAIESVR